MAVCRRPVPGEKNVSEKTAAAFSLVALTLWLVRREGIRG